ncbi:MAG: Nif3-like dinuclear metal center hexameric protein [Muribaculum sp.]|nr:Nif3-like dinuclear metal center hexameric protein [Muribaculum sp.]
MTRNHDITSVLEEFAPLSTQEEWDNSGFQVGDPDAECTGVLLCVDATEEIIREASERGCNLIISHHPVIFRKIGQILGRNRVERVIAKAIKHGVTIYSCHTPVDNARNGVSWAMAKRLGMINLQTLEPFHGNSETGLGIIGNLPQPLSKAELVAKVKEAFESPIARCSKPTADSSEQIECVALCGGAGADFIADAVRKGAQAYITSDTKHNYFLDYADDIFIIDIGHYESESCTKQIFYHVLSEKFPNFALHNSDIEKNPINYL